MIASTATFHCTKCFLNQENLQKKLQGHKENIFIAVETFWKNVFVSKKGEIEERGANEEGEGKGWQRGNGGLNEELVGFNLKP